MLNSYSDNQAPHRQTVAMQDVRMQELHGSITKPVGSVANTAVLILAGSGPVDRDGNTPDAHNNCLKLLAQGLAEHGIASLRADKRGVGQSRPHDLREDALRFDTYIEDAVAWVGYLRTQSGIDAVVLVGHSEGALVATLAAQRCKIQSLVLLAGLGEPADQAIRRQLAAAEAPKELQEASARIASSLKRGEHVTAVPPELQALYRWSAQNYLISWLPLEPAHELAKIMVPVLIVQGTTDLQVGINDAHSLAAAQPAAVLVLIEGMNHVLKDAPIDRVENLQTYYSPEKALAPALLPSIMQFLNAKPDANQQQG